MEQPQITGHQLRLIIVSSITVTGHLLFVPVVLNMAGRDGWLSLLMAIIPGLISASILTALGLSASGQSLIELSCTLMGKVLGKIAGLIYVGYFFLIPAITLRALMNFMTEVFMLRTPSLIFGVIFLLVCGYATFMGLEIFLRANEVLLPLLIIAGILASSMSFPDKDYKHLLPIMEEGISPVLLGSIPLIALMAEIVVIGMIQPALSSPTVLRKANIGAVLIISALFVGPLTGPIAVFGVDLAAKHIYPTYEQIKYIKLAFIENLQPLAVLLWLAGSFGKISLFYYASSLGAAQIFGLANYRRLVIPVGVIILMLAVVAFPNIVVIRKFISSSYAIISIGLGIIFPMVLLGIARLKNYGTFCRKNNPSP
ncbi:spore germination protein KB [Anaerosolibacter carboniphilus]|uniref:Spore germination protein KB n=1 Tax=Anaerosolibacter carboniphilus TaxID=1417629 RepID=A0A841KLP0_9FIRM|nr:endospore germination permease [Anaerosolibacter carboniphilus]MBB6214161.1 spore germination protein KB [Anaerosolibacter carboniphilus]